ncbi:MAG: Pectate lyase [uncultured bacterium]|nr:MAG: Pectate lyase [uncultured bacterium]
MPEKKISGLIVFLLFLSTVFCFADAIVIDHTCTDITAIPESAITQAKTSLHIAYGHTSHGSQLTTGMTSLGAFMNGKGYANNLYAYNNGGTNGALDLRDCPFTGASDLGNPNRTAWATSTRNYLNTHPEVNVIIWAWCGTADTTEANITLYLNQMISLEIDYPAVKFIYMTGHLNGTGANGNLNLRNEQIRNYCKTNGKILYDFADIESYAPKGTDNLMVKLADDACAYDSDGNSSRDKNWASDWQNSHTVNVDWYNCTSAHSQPLNANLKAYAAWHLWARLAGWLSDSLAPSVPTNLTATAVSSSQINLSWIAATDNVSVTGYKIFRGGVQVGISTTTSYSNTGLTPNTSYTYTISAYDAVLNESTLSSSATAITEVLYAFPGAEGFGAKAIGGRGGKVIKVKNLNDTGPGSFREAVMSTGSRIIVFEVSGIINLISEIFIKEPYLTIAGETSPGGILITGRQTSINTHNVIIRHMRFRVGSHGIQYGADPEQHDALDLFGNSMPSWFDGPGVSDVIIDHCSFSWGVDETMTADTGAHDFTIQWCIISEGLSYAGHPKGEHSKGLCLSQKFGGVYKASIHHNYFANNKDRNPLVTGPSDGDLPGVRWVDIRNNVVYNFKDSLSMGVQDNGAGNWIHNYVRRDGPESWSLANELNFWAPYPDANNLIYVQGNIGARRSSQSDPEWCVGDEWHEYLVTTNYQKTTPYNIIGGEVVTQIMSWKVANDIVNKVGSTVPKRDLIDERLMNEWKNGTGAIPLNVKYPDDFPTFQNIAPPQDQDNDGMADSWEQKQGFNTAIDDSALDADGNGYTNIEEYLHYLAEGTKTTSSLPAPNLKSVVNNNT